MNNFIKGIIEEKFTSKAQQRFFYAQAGKGGKKGKKWSKWAKEFSDKTDFEKIPDKIEKEVDEIVDNKGNINRSKIPVNSKSKGVIEKGVTDDVVKTTTGQMGSYGGSGIQPYRRFWGESDMSKSLGFKDTMGKDEDYNDAEDHFEKELGIPDDETKKRLGQMGYDENLPDDKVRLVENPKKFIEEYIENILSKKNINNEIVSNEEKEINPIVLKQLTSLKNTLKKNNLDINDVLKHLKNDE
jgi:hypothetical protein